MSDIMAPPPSGSSSGVGPSEADIKSWVRAELSPEMTRIDVTISSISAGPGGASIAVTNSAANTSSVDVIGNKSDRQYNGANSIYGIVHTLEDHAHKAGSLFPYLASGTAILCTSAAWELGNLTVLLPSGTAANPFDIHGVYIESIGGNGSYVLSLYNSTICAGSTVTTSAVIGSLSFIRSAVFNTNVFVPIQTPVVPANDCIWGRLANGAGAVQTAAVRLYYHEY